MPASRLWRFALARCVLTAAGWYAAGKTQRPRFLAASVFGRLWMARDGRRHQPVERQQTVDGISLSSCRSHAATLYANSRSYATREDQARAVVRAKKEPSVYQYVTNEINLFQALLKEPF